MKVKSISERENFLRAIRFEKPQWIPIIFDFTPALWKRYGDDLESLIQRYPLISGSHHRGYYVYNKEDYEPVYFEGVVLKDDWGCVWNNVQDGILGQVVGHPLVDWKSFDNYEPPNVDEQYDWAALKAHVEAEREKGNLTVAEQWLTKGGFFDRLVALRGYSGLMMDLFDQPPQLEKLIQMLLDYHIKYFKKWLDIGVDVVMHHGDIGSQKGLSFSPEIFRKLIKPAYKEMFGMCRDAGSEVYYSSDGDVLDVVDDFIECGITLHDPQVGPCGIDGIAEHYKGKLCAMADIDQQIMPFCKPEDIDREIKEVVEKVATPEGGLMIAAIPSHDVPFENIEAIFKAWEKYCFYNWPE